MDLVCVCVLLFFVVFIFHAAKEVLVQASVDICFLNFIDIYSVYFKHIQNHTKTAIISYSHKVGDIRTIKFATRILQEQWN